MFIDRLHRGQEKKETQFLFLIALIIKKNPQKTGVLVTFEL